MTVITRFAPSPTGYLHIGGARTALFNYLFAKNKGGKFLLRIEDTDKERSTKEAIEAIYNGLKWLGLGWDGEAVLQSERAARHLEAAQELLASGNAYYCYTTPEELEQMREKAQNEGKIYRYDGRWRNRDPKEAPTGVKPVIRLKAPQEGSTIIEDLVQGQVEVANNQLDDMILVRSDGSPTYMFAVVVDDHDMGITHIIRGDDHLTNAFRQSLIYQAMGWKIPYFAHIPLIHGPDGAKLSKRHGALGVEAYRDMGYLPEAMRNYLLRLGWSHGNDEIISTEQAAEWFNLEAVGKAPARFDFKKLDSLNAHYLRQHSEEELAQMITPILESITQQNISDEHKQRLILGLKGLKTRAKNLNELAENAKFYVLNAPWQLNEELLALITEDGKVILKDITSALSQLEEWQDEQLHGVINQYCELRQLKLGEIGQYMRIALTGNKNSPSIFEIMLALGKTETLQRISFLIP